MSFVPQPNDRASSRRFATWKMFLFYRNNPTMTWLLNVTGIKEVNSFISNPLNTRDYYNNYSIVIIIIFLSCQKIKFLIAIQGHTVPGALCMFQTFQFLALLL